MSHSSEQQHRAHQHNDHERSDVSPRVVVGVGVGLMTLVVLSIALVVGLRQSLFAPPEQSTTVFDPAERRPSTPALQANPQADLAALRARWRQQLHSYGWVDRDAGIARVPIEVAMDAIARNGLPETTAAPEVMRDSVDTDAAAANDEDAP